MTALRDVRCVKCGWDFQVPARASVLTCPGCYQRVRVEDIVINSAVIERSLETCGRLLIDRRGAVRAGRLAAGVCIEILGEVTATEVVAERLYIGPKGRLLGDCRAGAAIIEPGAVISGGRFSVGPVKSAG